MQAIREYQSASLALADGSEAAYDRFQRASVAMDATQGWDCESYANVVRTDGRQAPRAGQAQVNGL